MVIVVGDSRTCISTLNYNAVKKDSFHKTFLGFNRNPGKSVLMDILKNFERPCIPKQKSPFIIYDEFSAYPPKKVRTRHDMQVKPSKILLALLKRSRGS